MIICNFVTASLDAGSNEWKGPSSHFSVGKTDQLIDPDIKIQAWGGGSAGGMAQRLRALAVLPGDTGSIPSTHNGDLQPFQFQGIGCLLLASVGTRLAGGAQIKMQ